MKKNITIIMILLFIILICIVFYLIRKKQVNDFAITTVTENDIKIENISQESNTENSTNKKANESTNETRIVINDEKKPKTEEKKAKKSKNYNDVNEIVYAITTVHIREQDNENSAIIATIYLGDSVKRTGIGKKGWSRIEYNGKKAYIYTKYISTTKPPEPVEIELHTDDNRKIDKSKPMLALTFDDGPNPNTTPRILTTLEKYKCVATFFDLGIYMSNYPDITKKEEAIGCEVGSHTYAHKNLNDLSKDQIINDIKQAEDVYIKTLGHNLTLIRPPYGNANSTVKLTLNYPMINWDVDTEDWKSKDKKSILENIKKIGNLDGKIVLMHSIYASTADAVEELIPQLLKQGYQLVTVSELAKYKGVKLKTHTSYWGFKK